MDKLERIRGLIRYDSLRGLRGEKKRILRPRVWGYTALLLVGLIIAMIAVRKREPFEANIVRLAGMPYTSEAGMLRNAFELHVVNKSAEPMDLTVEPQIAMKNGTELAFVVPLRTVRVEPLGSRRLPVFVTMDHAKFTADRPFEIVIHAEYGKKTAEHHARAVFLGARP
jgi:polyferredoxin